MKTFFISLAVAAVAFAAGWQLGRRRAPIAVAVPGVRPVARNEALANAAARPEAATSSQVSGRKERMDVATLALADAIDALTSDKLSLGRRRALLEQLRKAGRLDEVIAGLKQLVDGNSADATVQTVLGEALLAKIRDIQENGGDPSDIPVLGLQADQDFSKALKADPGNWEAQFMKAASLAHWPPELNKGPEVVQMLQNLVAQQETLSPQPEFAQTYLLLSQQYQAAGQQDKALQTLQLGASKFPLNPGLQQALSRISSH